MGMGYAGAYADAVDEDWVKEVVPEEFTNFENALEKASVTLETFVLGSTDDWGDEVDQTYNDLLKKFEEVTGLELSVRYHDSESEGSRYDEVDGVFWAVDGVYYTLYTKAGETYKDRIKRVNYTIFG
jgi:hypothetical protein